MRKSQKDDIYKTNCINNNINVNGLNAQEFKIIKLRHLEFLLWHSGNKTY